ncbi:MAG: DUF3467 domain-containing protein [Elusimicrobiota bacterium]
MAEQDKQPEKQLEIEIDELTAQGVYVNLASITHSEAEFILDFIFIRPEGGKAKVRARIISSPTHTKRLMLALNENMKKYEEKFGPISSAPLTGEQKKVGFYH